MTDQPLSQRLMEMARDGTPVDDRDAKEVAKLEASRDEWAKAAAIWEDAATRNKMHMQMFIDAKLLEERRAEAAEKERDDLKGKLDIAISQRDSMKAWADDFLGQRDDLKCQRDELRDAWKVALERDDDLKARIARAVERIEHMHEREDAAPSPEYVQEKCLDILRAEGLVEPKDGD